MKSPFLQLNKAHYPVTVLGPGRRIGLWFQGCTIRCKGCVSQDTWDAKGGGRMTVEDMLAWCKRQAVDGLDGITLSGGEPFDQPLALGALLDAFERWRQRAHLDFDVLCYSGHPLKTLQARYAGLLNKLDAVISEPYVEGLPLGNVWCGSANQNLHPLSERGKARYTRWVGAPVVEKAMQVAVEGGRIWMIGIPDRGDMKHLEALCAERGLSLEQVSWRR